MRATPKRCSETCARQKETLSHDPRRPWSERRKDLGKKEVQLPEAKKYVKYTQNYKSRAIVDFDSGEILVETLDNQDPQRSSQRMPSSPRSGPRKIHDPSIDFPTRKSS